MADPQFYEDFDEEPQIDLTPLIDCLFMLILFFVLTMSFSSPVLEIVLPKSSSVQTPVSRNELLVNVRRDGSLWLNEEKSLTLEALAIELDANPERLLNIYMDAKAPFESFVRVLELAKVKRDGRFVISTREAQSTP